MRRADVVLSRNKRIGTSPPDGTDLYDRPDASRRCAGSPTGLASTLVRRVMQLERLASRCPTVCIEAVSNIKYPISTRHPTFPGRVRVTDFLSFSYGSEKCRVTPDSNPTLATAVPLDLCSIGFNESLSRGMVHSRVTLCQAKFHMVFDACSYSRIICGENGWQSSYNLPDLRTAFYRECGSPAICRKHGHHPE